jgi:hypothetical protein
MITKKRRDFENMGNWKSRPSAKIEAQRAQAVSGGALGGVVVVPKALGGMVVVPKMGGMVVAPKLGGMVVAPKLGGFWWVVVPMSALGAVEYWFGIYGADVDEG